MGASLRQRRAGERQEAQHADDSDSLVISDIESDLESMRTDDLPQSIHTHKEPLKKKLTVLERWMGAKDHTSEKPRGHRESAIEVVKFKERAKLLQYIKAKRRATANPDPDHIHGGFGVQQAE